MNDDKHESIDKDDGPGPIAEQQDHQLVWKHDGKQNVNYAITYHSPYSQKCSYCNKQWKEGTNSDGRFIVAEQTQKPDPDRFYYHLECIQGFEENLRNLYDGGLSLLIEMVVDDVKLIHKMFQGQTTPWVVPEINAEPSKRRWVKMLVALPENGEWEHSHEHEQYQEKKSD